MYLAAARYARILFWATLVAGFLTFLWPGVVPIWIPLVLGLVCGGLFLYVVMHPRRTYRLGWRCPHCGWVPFAIRAWKCKKCGMVWDSFATDGRCTRCAHQHDETACIRCRRIAPNWRWHVPVS